MCLNGVNGIHIPRCLLIFNLNIIAEQFGVEHICYIHNLN